MSNEQVLGLRIRFNDDGTIQVLNRTNQGLRDISTSAQQASRATDDTRRSFSQTALSALSMGDALRVAGAGFSIMGIAQYSKELIQTADTMTLMDSRIRIATTSQNDYVTASKGLLAVSIDTNTSLAENDQLFSRTNKAVEIMGGTVRDTVAMINTLDESLRISGATTSETESLTKQLSQAIASGVVRGDEFNSIMENGSRVAYALADGLHVNVGKLREMAEAGELSATKVIKAIMSQSDVIHAEFKRIPLTVGAAMQNIKTGFGQYVSSVDSGSAATSTLAEHINGLAKNLTPVLDGIVTLGEVAATVIGGQMVISIGQYVAAQYSSIVASRASAAARMVELESAVALTSRNLALAQSQFSATSLVTGARIAETQATLAGNIAMGARMAIGNQLNVLLAEQAAAQATLTAAQTAATAATMAQTAATVSFANGLKLLLIPINWVNLGLAGLVGWEVGKWLNSFETVRVVATASLGAIMQGIENVSYYWDRLKAVVSGNSDKLDGLKSAHLAQKTAIDDNIVSTIKYEMSGRKAAEATVNQAKVLTTLTGQQDKASDADKKGASAAQKKSDAIAKGIADEMKALDDQHKKLTLSERDYYANTLAAKGMSTAEKAVALAKWDIIKADEAQKAGADASKSAMDAEIDKYNQLTLSAQEYFKWKLKASGVKQEDIPAIAEKHQVNVALEDKKKSMEDAHMALKNYNASLDDAKTKTSELGSITSAIFDSSLGGINTAVGAFDKMVDSLSNVNDQLVKEAGNRAAINAIVVDPESKTYAEDAAKKDALLKESATKELKLNADVLEAKLSGGRQIASAMSSMLKKGSTEQKAAHAIAMGIAGAELAMQIMKVTGIGTVTAAETASIAPSVAASTTKGTAKAAEAVATQASAGPYIGFALMAAMAVAMAAIGFGVGGGAVSVPPPTSPDTGTVLGDPTAKSESIDKTYQLLKDIHASEYSELRGINAGVAALHDGITNVVTRLFQAGGIKDPLIDTKSKIAGIGGLVTSIGDIGDIGAKLPLIGDFIDGFQKFLFGGLFGKVTKSIVGGGIATGATPINGLIAGGDLSASQYATIETKKKSWFSSSTSYSEIYGEVDAQTQKALNGVFKSIGSTMLDLAGALGNDLTTKVNNAVIPAMKIELRGLSGEDAVKKLNGVLSATIDTMSSDIFGPLLGDYQQLGEGMLETTVRIVSEMALVKDAFHATSTTMGTDVIAISDAIVQALGGLQEFQKQFANYLDKFSSDSEKIARVEGVVWNGLKDIFSMDSIAAMGRSRDMFKQVMSAIDTNTESGIRQYSTLIALSSEIDQLFSYRESLAKKQRDLDVQTMEAQGNAVAALAEKRKDELAAMDATLRLSQSIVYAYQDANAKIKDATGGLTSSMSTMKTLVDGIKTALSSTVIESDALTRQKREAAQLLIKNAANSGAAIDSIPGLADALKDIAKPSSQLFATSIDYARDQGRTAANLEKLYSNATAQLSDAQKQLDAVNGTTSAVLTVADAIKNLQVALTSKQNVVQLETAKATIADLLIAKNTAFTQYTAANAALAAAQQARINYVGSVGGSTGSEQYGTLTNNIYTAMSDVVAKGSAFDAAVRGFTDAQNKITALTPTAADTVTTTNTATGGGAMIDSIVPDGGGSMKAKSSKDDAVDTLFNALGSYKESLLAMSEPLDNLKNRTIDAKEETKTYIKSLITTNTILSELQTNLTDTSGYSFSLNTFLSQLIVDVGFLSFNLNDFSEKLAGNKDAVMPTMGHLIGSAWGMINALDAVDNKLSGNKDAVMPTLGHLIGSAWGMSNAMDDVSGALTGPKGAINAIVGVRDSSAELIKTMQESNSALLAQMQALQQEVVKLRSATEATANNTRKTSDVLANVTRGGNEMVTTPA